MEACDRAGDGHEGDEGEDACPSESHIAACKHVKSLAPSSKIVFCISVGITIHDWSLGWWVGWSIGGVIDWSIDRRMFDDFSIDWLAGWSIDLIHWVMDWLVGRSIDWAIDWLMEWLIDWLLWLIDWWFDWLSARLGDWFIKSLLASLIISTFGLLIDDWFFDCAMVDWSIDCWLSDWWLMFGCI